MLQSKVETLEIIAFTFKLRVHVALLAMVSSRSTATEVYLTHAKCSAVGLYGPPGIQCTRGRDNAVTLAQLTASHQLSTGARRTVCHGRFTQVETNDHMLREIYPLVGT